MTRAPLSERCALTASLIVLAIGVAAASLDAPAQTAATRQPVPHRVLILQSYYSGDVLTSRVRQGLDGAFASSGLRVEQFVEALDANRVNVTEQYLDEFAAFLKSKYLALPLEVVVVCDNDAFEFLRVRRDALFPGVPVVFLGIDDFSEQMLDGRTDITGVAGHRDDLASVEMVRRLWPSARELVAITDNSRTGRAERAAIQAIAPRFPPGFSLRFLSLGDYTLEELGDRLAALGPESAVLMLHGSVDRNGTAYSAADTTPFLSARSPVPIFVIGEARVGLGALGGLVASGEEAGLAAGQMAVQILKGKDVRHIPLVTRNPTKPLFDYAVIRRFGLSVSDLPPGSEVINRPTSLFEQHRGLFLSLAAVFVCVTAFAVVLGLEVLRRRRVEASLRKSQETLSGILNLVPQGIFWKDRDGIYLGCNDVFARAVGLPGPGALVGKTDFDLPWAHDEAVGYRLTMPRSWSRTAPSGTSSSRSSRRTAIGAGSTRPSCR
jgi:PAS domain-containing protein